MEYSFGLLKPDCLRRGITSLVVDEIRQAGLTFVIAKGRILTKKQVRTIWKPCIKEEFFPRMLEFQTSGISLVFIVKGDNAISILNELVGPYDPAKGNGIRHRYGTSKMENVIHSTKDAGTFMNESSLFFQPREYVDAIPMLVIAPRR